ncbi:hypothetical protein [Puia sp.]|uniref:hypothetical protein n=1 Tax=Puia sp. TaxID=2045100 RepID=UPI002F422895
MCLLSSLLFCSNGAKGQPTFPSTQVDQSYVPASPNVAAFQRYGNNPVALFEGAPAVTLPVYEVKLGSLSLPISLSYNYNGFEPMKDAGWVGLGWNLSVGGAISRIVEGQVDSTRPAGLNYGQYTYADSLTGDNPNLNNFLAEHYDLAPDVFDVELATVSGKFIWCNGKAFQLDYDKKLGISWPSVNSDMTVTSDDGTIYVFGAKEVTTSNIYWYGSLSDSTAYNSAWLLTSVISADKKDTITLNYTTYSWKQAPVNYQNTYVSSDGTQLDLGYDPTLYQVAPTISAQVLTSVTYRNGRVSFLPSTRTDINGTYPSLGEIDVIDSLTGATVRKNVFSYEYFHPGSGNAANQGHLKLKSMTTVNPSNANDTMAYRFSYIHEYGDFPLKATLGIDYWGYYNGNDGNSSLLPSSTSPYYSVTPSSNFGGSNSRDPNFDYGSYAALDTIAYPTGGYTVYQYEQNISFDDVTTSAAPGIRVVTATDYDRYKPTPALQKHYSYVKDDGVTSSGVLLVVPNFGGYNFVTVTDGSTANYNTYKAEANSGDVGGRCPKFYYSKVTETVSSGGETHKTDYYYTGLPTLFQDVRLAERVDYSNDPNTNYFSPVQKIDYGYNVVTDTNFLNGYSYILQETIDHLDRLPIQYSYYFVGDDWTTYWISPSSQTTTQYDVHGNSIATTTTYRFNPSTRNLTTIQQTGSDGQTLVQKMKYPEDYVSGLTGNMVAGRVLNPVIEKETWLKKDASDSSLIDGQITQYDQTLFKPVVTYGLETTSPVPALSNETTSGGKYSSLISSSQYVQKGQIQYDGNGLPSTTAKSSDMNMSFIWDYRHSRPVAEVRNAAQADIGFSSFEADGAGGIQLTNNGTGIIPTDGISGTHCYQINYGLAKTGLDPAKTYVVSLWAKSGTPSYNGYNGSTQVVADNNAWTTGKTINSWTYLEKTMTGVTTINVSGGGGLVDEVRFYPANAQMTTYTYAPLVGMTSQCDVDNRITYYQYDGFGRLNCVKDQDGNILKTVEYHYQGH